MHISRFQIAHESHPHTLQISKTILQALPTHKPVATNIAKVPGWDNEGNIFYHANRFKLKDKTAIDIGQKEKDRRLFIAILVCIETNTEFMVSTAHFTWQGHVAEYETDMNVRKDQARRATEVLSECNPMSIPVIFGGDLNESFWPKRIFENSDFKDCFEALGLPVRPTHPTRPSLAHEERNADAALDWLFFWNDPDDDEGKRSELKVLLSTVIKDMRGLSSDDPDERKLLAVQPSDHMPVMAVFRLTK